ncbi:MAG TPA: undecaprenyl-diphosphatase UppP [Anaerolineales bacterium]|nr:undecaprenyl-diphosphatase UppP [Anaerolineales bacterium]
MTLLQSFLLGIIQGLTEFIPISSTGHLLIAQYLLGIPASDEVFAFLVIVQLGTLVSLFAFYWKDLVSIAGAVLRFRQATPERNLGIYILLATIPALVVGYFLNDLVERFFQQPMLQASIRLFTAAALMSIAERFSPKNRQLSTMAWYDALFVGAMQILAVFPGASRSGTTISGGMFRGFDRPSAARFAFLMAVPVMLAAGGFELLEVFQMPNSRELLPSLAVGFVTAALVGWFSIKWLIDYLSRRSLYVFAIYCAIVGTITFLLR